MWRQDFLYYKDPARPQPYQDFLVLINTKSHMSSSTTLKGQTCFSH
ncbi:hypothetical protein GLYMA_03G183700v4 [Glycine max]|uniref:Uncharacterized protein n=1 Tax=Glycine max TaxID=3847 RepID=A0A0R0KSY6_SOYBN|nr:hypothetical protein GYH30_007629 [Glycine max]KRH67731.1 hypothetical protein GLYMA_03G183700v4 [Glycine max]